MDDTSESSEFVNSLARGLAVISVFNAQHPVMTLSEVAQQTNLSRATARRFLLTLVELGYMSSDGKFFRLTPKVLNLGYAYLSSLSLWDVAEPLLLAVTNQLDEACALAVWDKDVAVYVGRIPVRRIMAATLNVGTRLPAYCTSVGRVLLAGLAAEERQAYLTQTVLNPCTPHTTTTLADLEVIIAQVSKQGYSLVNQEFEVGLISLALPILNKHGKVLAAVSVNSHISRMDSTQMLTQCLPVLNQAAQQICSGLYDYVPR